MTFKPTQDRINERSSRTIATFAGVHYGMGRCDQGNEHSASCDLDFANQKARVRLGARKNASVGWPGDVDDMFFISLGGRQFLALIVNGVLSCHPVDDIKDGVRRYYTWDEIRRTFSWSDLTAYQWNELYQGL